MQHGCRRMTIIGLDDADYDQGHAQRDKARLRESFKTFCAELVRAIYAIWKTAMEICPRDVRY
jgi:hypothetical protein